MHRLHLTRIEPTISTYRTFRLAMMSKVSSIHAERSDANPLDEATQGEGQSGLACAAARVQYLPCWAKGSATAAGLALSACLGNEVDIGKPCAENRMQDGPDEEGMAEACSLL